MNTKLVVDFVCPSPMFGFCWRFLILLRQFLDMPWGPWIKSPDHDWIHDYNDWFRWIYPRCSMVLEYLPTELGHFWCKCSEIFHTLSIWVLYLVLQGIQWGKRILSPCSSPTRPGHQRSRRKQEAGGRIEDINKWLPETFWIGGWGFFFWEMT